MGQNVGQIMANVVKKVKKGALSIVFFVIFYMEDIFLSKKKSLHKHLSEKVKVNIARNATFEGHYG